jgi:hypothetical protein
MTKMVEIMKAAGIFHNDFFFPDVGGWYMLEFIEVMLVVFVDFLALIGKVMFCGTE